MVLPTRASFWLNNATNSFPYNQARLLWSSCFGTWPNWMIDFKRFEQLSDILPINNVLLK